MTNAILEQMDKNDILLGAQKSFLNAKSLFDSADLISRNKTFGPANSLLILSAEECIKCFILVSVYFGRDLDFKVDPFFSIHGEKHKEAAKLQKYINDFSIIAPLLTDISRHGLPRGKTIAIAGLSLLFDSKTEKTDPKRFAKWWADQNNQKNNGLYVGYKDSQWIAPSDVAQETFNETLSYVYPFIDCLELVTTFKKDDYKRIPKDFIQNLRFNSKNNSDDNEK